MICVAYRYSLGAEDPEDPEVVDPEVYSESCEADATEPVLRGLSSIFAGDTLAGSGPAAFGGCFSFTISLGEGL
jgi:hypothetical protein